MAVTVPGVSVTCRDLVFIYRLDGYDVVALSRVDLDIAAGESVALVGPSGSGKSTLLALIAGLLRPAAGRLRVGDHDLVKADDRELQAMRASEIGVVLQGADRNLVPYLSAVDNVRFAQRGVASAQRSGLSTPTELLTLVGLEGAAILGARPAELLPGQRQRLSLAVGAAIGGGLLLADEPTSQLDAEARDEVVEALLAMHATGRTVVVVTHDPDIGDRMGRTVTIRDGRIGAEGRRGEDFLVVGTDGAVHLPLDITNLLPVGTLLRAEIDQDMTVHLKPVDVKGEKGSQ